MSAWIDPAQYDKARLRRNILAAYLVCVCVGFMAGSRYGWLGVAEAMVVGLAATLLAVHGARVEPS